MSHYPPTAPSKSALPGEDQSTDPVVIIGAGPGGLTAAHDLTTRGVNVVVFEHDDCVGGISRTVEYKGFRFDIGGHRFFTKVRIVNELWRKMLGKDFLRRPRLSRIYYNQRFFDYPLKPLNALSNLGVWTSVCVLFSYLWVRVRPIRPEVSFEDWVSNRFGRRLYEIFFRSYTEKVWGMPCSSIDAQWASQRIRGLSFTTAVINMLVPSWNSGDQTVKTLIDEFEYPRLGPGMMWDAFKDRIQDGGGRVEVNASVVGLVMRDQRVTGVKVKQNGRHFVQPASHVISTMPMRHLFAALGDRVPPAVQAAAKKMSYRDFLTVALVVDRADVFRDNWIYIHDPNLQVGRIQNYKNWSPEMVPDESQTCLGLEYFCFEGDGLWSMEDSALVALASRELHETGLVLKNDIVDGTVVRMPKAYPVYDSGYADRLEGLKGYLATIENLQLVGRNGMHKYNNQDHAMLTALLAVDNIFGADHDLWAVNADEEYHEESYAKDENEVDRYDVRELSRTQPRVPTPLASSLDTSVDLSDKPRNGPY